MAKHLCFLKHHFLIRVLEKMERRDLKDERIQIPNEDLTIAMFDIDKKDFESGEAFLKADIMLQLKATVERGNYMDDVF